MTDIQVRCDCWIHNGETVTPTRHEVAIAICFRDSGQVQFATRKTRTIIDLLLAGF